MLTRLWNDRTQFLVRLEQVVSTCGTHSLDENEGGKFVEQSGLAMLVIRRSILTASFERTCPVWHILPFVKVRPSRGTERRGKAKL